MADEVVESSETIAKQIAEYLQARDDFADVRVIDESESPGEVANHVRGLIRTQGGRLYVFTVGEIT